MKINSFQGELTDISAKKEALVQICFKFWHQTCVTTQQYKILSSGEEKNLGVQKLAKLND